MRFSGLWNRGRRWTVRGALVALAVAGLLAGACGSEPEASTSTDEAALADAEAAAIEARTEAEAARARADEAQATAVARGEELEAAHGELAVASEEAASARNAMRRAEQELAAVQVELDEGLARLAAQAATEIARADGDVIVAEEAVVAAREELSAARGAVERAKETADASSRELEAARQELAAAIQGLEEAEAVAAAANAAAEAARTLAAAAQAEAAEAAAQAAAAEAALAQEQAAAASTSTPAAETTPDTTSAAASPPGPPQDVATEDMGADDMDVMMDDMADGMAGDMSSAGSAAAAPPAPAAPSAQLPPSECRGCEGNTFEDYGVNPFVRTDEDPLSTFALDVDTASYVVARNFLRGDELPPPEAVRVEEFVNYFDGGYEPVPDEFAVDLEAAPSPFAADGHVLLRVGVRAPDVLAGVAVPESIVVVMDRSGSMDGIAGYRGERLERIDLAHRAVELLLEGLADGTRVGIVSYDDQVETVVEPTDVAGSRDGIMTRVRYEVTPRGSTNAAAGLAAGYEMALGEAEAGRSVLVLLVSDGVANVGATRTTEILEQIGERGDIGLSTIGVGLGPFNDALMEQLANSADGTYHYIDSFREARRIFADNLPSLLSVAARDAKIQVEFDPATVRSYRLLGFENRDVADDDFRDNTVDAGEVGLGQSSTALYELELVPAGERPGGATTLATVTLRYEHPRRGSITEIEAGIGAGDVAASFDAAGARFRLAAVVAEFAEVLRASPFVDEAHTDMAVLATEAAAVAQDLATDPDVADLVSLIDAARRAAGDGTGGG